MIAGRSLQSDLAVKISFRFIYNSGQCVVQSIVRITYYSAYVHIHVLCNFCTRAIKYIRYTFCFGDNKLNSSFNRRIFDFCESIWSKQKLVLAINVQCGSAEIKSFKLNFIFVTWAEIIFLFQTSFITSEKHRKSSWFSISFPSYTYTCQHVYTYFFG